MPPCNFPLGYISAFVADWEDFEAVHLKRLSMLATDLVLFVNSKSSIPAAFTALHANMCSCTRGQPSGER